MKTSHSDKTDGGAVVALGGGGKDWKDYKGYGKLGSGEYGHSFGFGDGFMGVYLS